MIINETSQYLRIPVYMFSKLAQGLHYPLSESALALALPLASD
jgi:hypothetical protein